MRWGEGLFVVKTYNNIIYVPTVSRSKIQSNNGVWTSKIELFIGYGSECKSSRSIDIVIRERPIQIRNVKVYE